MVITSIGFIRNHCLTCSPFYIGLVGKYQKMGNGAKTVEKLVPKLGKLKGTKVSSRLNFPWNDDQRKAQYIQWTAHFVTIFPSSILTFCATWGHKFRNGKMANTHLYMVYRHIHFSHLD